MSDSLNQMHRSILPTSIRDTLNQSAFDVKKTELNKSAKKAFINRTKTFFKKNSGVNKAIGWDVTKMVSTVGMLDNDVTEGFEKQEEGGAIKNRGYIPMNTSRISKNINKKVSKKNYRRGKPVFSGRGRSSNVTNSQKFIKAAFKAGVNGYMIHKNTLFRVDRIRINKKNRKIKIKSTAIAHYNKSKVANLKATNFMQKAAKVTIQDQQANFDKFALNQINKLKQKNKI